MNPPDEKPQPKGNKLEQTEELLAKGDRQRERGGTSRHRLARMAKFAAAQKRKARKRRNRR